MAITVTKIVKAMAAWNMPDSPRFASLDTNLAERPDARIIQMDYAMGARALAFRPVVGRPCLSDHLSAALLTAVPAAAPAAAPIGPPTTAPATAPVEARCSTL